MNITDLMKNAEKLGIATSHYDIDGNLIHAGPETLRYFTEFIQDSKKVRKSAGYFDDVAVFFETEPIQYDVSKLGLSSSSITYQLFSENGQLVSEASAFSTQSIELSSLSYGYYLLVINDKKKHYRVRLLVSPKNAYQPPILAQEKTWGLNIQLYSLRSKQNWGIGDFADLRYLIEHASQYGVNFIGINPLHLMYSATPEWASPYSSSSRRWLNPIYLDIVSLPEFKLSKKTQTWFASESIQQQLASLREAELVDYTAVTQLKQTALFQLFDFSKQSQSAQIKQRREAFKQFMQEQGDALLLQGLFEVLDHQAKRDEMSSDNIGWLGWRAEWQHLQADEKAKLLRKHQKHIECYAWQQWLMSEQLAEMQACCQKHGMALGIYGDLAVSSSCGSVDVWSDPDLYFMEASVGAPPDPLGPFGQNWHLPPYNPAVLKARGFQPFIDMLRANMQHFGILRIDHVMGLFRLWLIPKGKTAADGVYVHYPFAELMAILAIESQRNRCLVIGEDLGTVPNEVRSKLNEFQIFSYFVLYFAQTAHQYPAGESFPLKAFATIGTHDVPSLQSFWHCVDLSLFKQLGVLSDEVLKQKYDQRVIDKQALLNTLHRDHYLPDDYGGDALSMAMHAHLNYVIHQYLAQSRTQLIGVQLENLLSQEVSFNLPGTDREYPNWRKKLACELETMFADEHITSFLTSITQARQQCHLSNS
ncbi:4-alpha-glucanotransferase [Pasteurella sp. PK-2025]|uniref:4-alpha-glucanotransferase n=1 Tax=Pasteurella sp. PK-2025 TaxID=3413133 RepID=UPI003C71B268